MEECRPEKEGQAAEEGMAKANEESGQQREDKLQMAPKGLILADIGVVMGSRSPQVFMEYVELYPGARKIYDFVSASPCDCNNPMCTQDTFQRILEAVAGDDKELAARFIQQVDSDPNIRCLRTFKDFYLTQRQDLMD